MSSSSSATEAKSEAKHVCGYFGKRVTITCDEKTVYDGYYEDDIDEELTFDGKGKILVVDEYASSGEEVRETKILCEYEGDIKDDLPHGKGKWKRENTQYEGDFENGMKHGKGTIKFPQYQYEGDFTNNKIEGFGRQTFFDTGNVYEGQFVDGKRNGEFTLFYSNGATWKGEFKDDKPCNGGLGKVKCSCGVEQEAYISRTESEKNQTNYLTPRKKKNSPISWFNP
jgi:hypothetical protein